MAWPSLGETVGEASPSPSDTCKTLNTWVVVVAGAMVLLLLLIICLSIRCLRRTTPMGKEHGKGVGVSHHVLLCSPLSCPSRCHPSIPDPSPSLIPLRPSSCSIPSVPLRPLHLHTRDTSPGSVPCRPPAWDHRAACATGG